MPILLLALFLLATPAVARGPVLAVQTEAERARCLRRFAVVGLPQHRSAQAAAEQFKPAICRRGYALSFNMRTRNPDWVAERLSPARLRGSAKRSNRFVADPLLAAISPVSADFRKSGFDRGHQAPAANSAADRRAMDESFYMSNISPQVGPGFNRGLWRTLEANVRRWVLCGHDDVIVFTGPVYGASARTISSRPILVPDGYYKIVYDVRLRRAVGFKLFNRSYPRTSLRTVAVPIDRIEDETGIDFFPALPPGRQARIEATAGEPWTCPRATSSR